MGESGMDDANVKVAVRVRPMNRRGEKDLQAAFYCLYPPGWTRFLIYYCARRSALTPGQHVGCIEAIIHHLHPHSPQ